VGVKNWLFFALYFNIEMRFLKDRENILKICSLQAWRCQSYVEAKARLKEPLSFPVIAVSNGTDD
jgi:hypothetical protein